MSHAQDQYAKDKLVSKAITSLPAPPSNEKKTAKKKELPSWIREEILKTETTKIKQREKELALEHDQALRSSVTRAPLTGYEAAVSPPDSPQSDNDDQTDYNLRDSNRVGALLAVFMTAEEQV